MFVYWPIITWLGSGSVVCGRWRRVDANCQLEWRRCYVTWQELYYLFYLFLTNCVQNCQINIGWYVYWLPCYHRKAITWYHRKVLMFNHPIPCPISIYLPLAVRLINARVRAFVVCVHVCMCACLHLGLIVRVFYTALRLLLYAPELMAWYCCTATTELGNICIYCCDLNLPKSVITPIKINHYYINVFSQPSIISQACSWAISSSTSVSCKRKLPHSTASILISG